MIVFVDNILIYLRSREEYETHLRIALLTLQELPVCKAFQVWVLIVEGSLSRPCCNGG